MYPNEYIEYLVHFHGDRDYFECHEILEEYWKKREYGNKQSVWVGLIQLAVSCYHHRRGNYTGAKKTLEKAIRIFITEKNFLKNLGLDEPAFFSLLENRYTNISQKQRYHSFNLPLNDPILIRQCQTLCSKLGFTWCNDSDVHDSFLMHRHKLRDRTNVIQARDNALKTRKGGE